MYVCIRKLGRKGVLIQGQALVCHYGLGVGASLRVLIIEVSKAFDSAFLNYFC